MSRLKSFCPRCEEVYVPKAKQVNIYGAAFGSSFPHVLLTHYPMVVILPAKIYNYESKIYGFKIAGKRGSKYFEPSNGNVRIVEDSLQSIKLEMIKNKQVAELAQAFDLEVNLEQAQQNSK